MVNIIHFRKIYIFATPKVSVSVLQNISSKNNVKLFKRNLKIF